MPPHKRVFVFRHATKFGTGKGKILLTKPNRTTATFPTASYRHKTVSIVISLCFVSNTSFRTTRISSLMCQQPATTMGSLSAAIAANRNSQLKRQKEGASSEGPRQKKLRTEESHSSKVGTLTYSDQDVLSGRGGGTNLHVGNRIYRNLILSHRETYESVAKAKKPSISRKIVQMIRDSGGRFLRKDKDGLYYDIGDNSAREKTSQALRHRTFEMRRGTDDKASSTKSVKPNKIGSAASLEATKSQVSIINGSI